jgi:hypothetical protein
MAEDSKTVKMSFYIDEETRTRFKLACTATGTSMNQFWLTWLMTGLTQTTHLKNNPPRPHLSLNHNPNPVPKKGGSRKMSDNTSDRSFRKFRNCGGGISGYICLSSTNECSCQHSKIRQTDFPPGIVFCKSDKLGHPGLYTEISQWSQGNGK